MRKLIASAGHCHLISENGTWVIWLSSGIPCNSKGEWLPVETWDLTPCEVYGSLDKATTRFAEIIKRVSNEIVEGR